LAKVFFLENLENSSEIPIQLQLAFFSLILIGLQLR
jgi:hypothetical protein